MYIVDFTTCADEPNPYFSVSLYIISLHQATVYSLGFIPISLRVSRFETVGCNKFDSCGEK